MWAPMRKGNNNDENRHTQSSHPMGIPFVNVQLHTAGDRQCGQLGNATTTNSFYRAKNKTKNKNKKTKQLS